MCIPICYNRRGKKEQIYIGVSREGGEGGHTKGEEEAKCRRPNNGRAWHHRPDPHLNHPPKQNLFFFFFFIVSILYCVRIDKRARIIMRVFIKSLYKFF